ncbi:hypothetical protein RZS08_28780, partial [Arthrospira platensis SPKY1]|nr:hypothetical protein [Arthrospira platensis SPKY1]
MTVNHGRDRLTDRLHRVGNQVGRASAEGPAQVPVTGVVEHVRLFATAHPGHHVGHHRAQPGPWHHLPGVHTGEAL